MVKVAVLVSGGGTNLQALIDAESRGENPYGKLTLVLADTIGAYALERARQAGIEGVAIDKRSRDFEQEALALLAERQIDVIVLAGFMTILSGEFVRRYENRILNVHPALIPAFCGQGFYGLHVHEAALARGVKVSGATVHLVNEIADGGPILLQKAVDVLEGDTPQTLQRRIMEEAEWQLLPRALAMVCQILADGGTI